MEATGVSAAGLRIARRFARCDGRVLHYRCAGDGPPVVLLHDSPRSSRLHLATIAHLARSFRVYALDTPGYGNSDPLPLDTPGIPDFAAALGQALEALGLGEAPIYATHTSAKIALEYAAGHGHPPGLVLDGLSIPTARPDPAFIDAYMRPFTIEATGSYIAAEWTRMRDMFRWFPWFDRRPQTRMTMAMPEPGWIADYVIDHFSAGAAYSSAYRAAMYYDPMPALRSVGCPTLVAARADDVLYTHLDRVPEAENAMLAVERLGTAREAWLEWMEQALERAGARGAAAPAPMSAATLPDGPSYVDLAHGQMLVHASGFGAASTPLLILDTPAIMQAREWQSVLDERPTLVPELPGFGESDPLPVASLDSAADALIAMLDALRIEIADIAALGFASPLGAMLAARHPHRIGKVVLDGCFDLPDRESAQFAAQLSPAPAFDIAGGHLHRGWHMLRDTTANWPWFAQHSGARRDIAVEIPALRLHQALVGLLKQPETYGDLARAACLRPAADRYPAFPQPALVFERPGDAAYAGAAEVAGLLPRARLVAREGGTSSAAEMVRTFLNAHSPGDAA